MGYKKRLDRAFDRVSILPMCPGSRYVLFSDCHRGNGTNNDNFLKNQHLYMAALRYYLKNQYTYMELGDGDELWENRKMEQIAEVHGELQMKFMKIFIFNRKRSLLRHIFSYYGRRDCF